MCKILIIWAIVWIFFIPVNGQNMHVSLFSESNGLPSNQVRHVAQDTFGFLWIATDNGLVRFDGSRFVNYSKHLPSRYGRHFCTTNEGLLLSNDEGISLIKPGLDTTIFSTYLKASIDPKVDALYYPDQLFQQSNGDIWISQAGGEIHRISSGDANLNIKTNTSYEDKSIKAFFAEIASKAIWVADSKGGLYFFNANTGLLEQKAILPVINNMKSSGNELWIAGDHLYRFQLNDNGNQIEKKETYNSELGEVTTLALDSKENIFLGIKDKGLFFLDRKHERQHKYIKVFSNNDPHRVDELPFKNINKIVLISDEELWICSAEGLGILQKRFFETVGSIPNAHTTSISVAENGRTFVNFGDIYAIESTDLGFDGHGIPSYIKGTVTALTTSNNNLWVGTSLGMLINLTQDGKQISSVNLKQRGEGIFYLFRDSSSRLWICQAPKDKPIVGIGCLQPDGSMMEYDVNKGFENRILCLKETTNGRIYASGIGATTYLYRYLPEEDTFINLSLPFKFYVNPNFEVHDFTVDNEGIIWLASTDGLLKHDMDRINKVDLGSEFGETEIRSVLSMPDGSIWMSTDTEGVLRYEKGETVLMQEECGLPSKVMSYRCLIKDRQLRLWIGTAEGMVYSLDTLPKPHKSNRPWLISCTIDGNKYATDKINLFRDQSFTLEYVSPAFNGYRTFYQYKINNEGWSEPSINRNLTIANLLPSDYVLKIRSRQEGSYIWSKPTTVNVHVREYWYKNRTFLWLLGGFSIVLIYSFFILRKRKYLQHIEVLSHGLEKGEKEIIKKEADLAKAKSEMRLGQKQQRVSLLSLEVMHRLMSKIRPGMKWDTVLEIISGDLFKIPGVIAFEIGIRENKTLEFEGYSLQEEGFTDARIPYDPGSCLAAYCINTANAMVLNNLPRQSIELLNKKDLRLHRYKSAISVPFFLNNKNAIFSIYSEKENFFEDYALKAMSIFATYLEQINQR